MPTVWHDRLVGLVRWGCAVALAGVACGPEPSPRVEVLVSRAAEEGGTRLWILDPSRDRGSVVPRPADPRNDAGHPISLGWSSDGRSLHIADEALWRYAGGSFQRFPAGAPSPVYGPDAVAGSVLPDEAIAVIHTVGSGSLPGACPPPRESRLFLVDSELEGVDFLDSGGGVGGLTAGHGPVVVFRRTTWLLQGECLDEDMWFDPVGSWHLWRGGELEGLEGVHAGTPSVSSSGETLAWRSETETVFTDLEGQEREAVARGAEVAAWSDDGRVYAGASDAAVWAFELDTGRLEDHPIEGVVGLAWAPDGNRLLAEVSCDEDGEARRQVVVEGGEVVHQTPCAAEHFVAWGPRGEMFGIQRSGARCDDARFRLVEVGVGEREPLTGELLSFRPDPGANR